MSQIAISMEVGGVGSSDVQCNVAIMKYGNQYLPIAVYKKITQPPGSNTWAWAPMQ